jgi:D-3-phosphoglycerate dehydrogenase
MTWRVLISAPYFLPVLNEYRSRLETAGVEIVTVPVCERLSEEELLPLVATLDGVLCGDDKFSERVLQSAPRLKVISKWGTGIDSIDRVAAERLGIRVCNTPNAFTDPVADAVLGYVINFARRLSWMDQDIRREQWTKPDSVSLRECTLGVVGLGNIGKAVVRRARAFGMKVLGTDPAPVSAAFIEETGLTIASLPELLAQADFISLNCDLNPTSFHLIGRGELDLMRRSAFLINTARGPVVDEPELVLALQKRRIAGAALDVFEQEPLPLESPLRKLDNCLLAPHNANSGRASRLHVHESTIANLLGALREAGEKPRFTPNGNGEKAQCVAPTVNLPLGTTCKAVVIHGAGQASLDEVTIPEVGPDDVAIQVAYAGICVTDLEIARGTLGYYQDEIAKYPIVPGHEVSGSIVVAGGDVAHLVVGDSVVVECIHGCGACHACGHSIPIECDERTELGVIGRNGGYTEFLVVPARFVHRVPASLDLRQACLAEPLAVALKGLKRLARAWGADSQPKTCAVLGAGPLGRLCALVLAHRGHEVTLFDQDTRRLSDIGPSIATSQTLDHLREFDALVEATGQQPALEAALETSRTGATILLIGLPYARAAFSFERIVAYDKVVVGSVGSSANEFVEALALLAALDTAAFTQTVLPLAQFEQGWEAARTRSHLKVLLALRGM